MVMAGGRLRYVAPRGLSVFGMQRELHVHARAHLTAAAVARRVLEQSLGRPTASASLRSPRGGSRHAKAEAKAGATTEAHARALAEAKPPSKPASAGGGNSPRLRVLLLPNSQARRPVDAPMSTQMSTLLDGLRSNGAQVEQLLSQPTASGRALSQPPAARAHGRKREGGGGRAGGREAKPIGVAELAASHARAPYALVIAELGTDGVDDEVARTLAAVLGKPRRGGHAPSGALPTNGTRVACVRSDARPPAVWQLWLPSFCTVGFVREMRLLW